MAKIVFLIKILIVLIGFSNSLIIYTSNNSKTNNNSNENVNKLNQENFIQVDPPIINIDLDLPPEKRWLQESQIIDDMCTESIKLNDSLNQYYIAVVFNEDKEAYENYKNVLLAHQSSVPSDFIGEIKSYVQRCKIDDFGLILFNNFVYEIIALAGCTSITIKLPGDKMNLFSNLDYVFPSLIGEIIFKGRYLKNNKVIYEATSVFGINGILRTYNQNNFATAINERVYNVDKQEILEKIKRGVFYYPTMYLFKYVNEKAESYQDAINLFTTSKTLSSFYVTITDFKGKTGAIIQKDVNSENTKIFNLRESNPDWYLVQTNSDRDVWDYRRYGAELKLNSMTVEEKTPINIFSTILAKLPNFAQHGVEERTISSSYIDENNIFKIVIWKKTDSNVNIKN